MLLHHAIKHEYGGWRVWVDTLAIVHSKVKLLLMFLNHVLLLMLLLLREPMSTCVVCVVPGPLAICIGIWSTRSRSVIHREATAPTHIHTFIQPSSGSSNWNNTTKNRVYFGCCPATTMTAARMSVCKLWETERTNEFHMSSANRFLCIIICSCTYAFERNLFARIHTHTHCVGLLLLFHRFGRSWISICSAFE